MRTIRWAGLNVRITGGSDREGGGTGPVVVLLHGYGAPGDDLVPLYRVLDVPREVRFVFPEAPLSPAEFATFGGRAWWPIDISAMQRAMQEGRVRERTRELPQGVDSAHTQLTGMLDVLERELNVASDRIVLGGFSQGSMLACDVALRGSRKFAGLVLLSSTLLGVDTWQPLMAAQQGLPILQTHGTHDPLLPYAMAVELRDLWQAAGAAVEFVSFPGGHELPNAVLDAVGRFVRQRFPQPA
jgi:phospholipase/carboxylesterase